MKINQDLIAPSTERISPVTYEAISLARKRNAFAMSSASPILRRGMRLMSGSIISFWKCGNHIGTGDARCNRVYTDMLWKDRSRARTKSDR